MRTLIMITGAALIGMSSLSSCATRKKQATTATADPSTSAAALQQKWMIKEMRAGNNALLLEKKAYITFSKEEARGGAHFGCNGMGFDYSIPTPGIVKFGSVLSTMMFCEGISQMEHLFAQTVEQELHYEIKGHFLYLKDSKGVFITAVRPDWD